MSETNEPVALVTGGGSGMGQAIAWGLAQDGYRVAVIGRTVAKLQATVTDARAAGRVAACPGDVSDRQEMADRVETIEEELGPVAVLVSNAGVNVVKRSLDDLSGDDWDKMIAINLTGAYNVVRAVWPGMKRRGGGLIVHISSIAGVRGFEPAGAAYTASKYGVNGLSSLTSLEGEPHGIRSTVICPGEVNTPILDQRPQPVPAERKKVMLQPDDVAAAVRMVAKLPKTAHVPELIITPTYQRFS